MDLGTGEIPAPINPLSLLVKVALVDLVLSGGNFSLVPPSSKDKL